MNSLSISCKYCKSNDREGYIPGSGGQVPVIVSAAAALTSLTGSYREMHEEQSSYSAKDFLMKLIAHAPFPIRMIQTDKGVEFTNALIVVKARHRTLFEQAPVDMGIEYHRIRIATPRHNGKVERQHRIDGERFYSRLRMFSLEDGRKQLADYQRRSNRIRKPCLGMKSPNQVVEQYLGVM